MEGREVQPHPTLTPTAQAGPHPPSPPQPRHGRELRMELMLPLSQAGMSLCHTSSTTAGHGLDLSSVTDGRGSKSHTCTGWAGRCCVLPGGMDRVPRLPGSACQGDSPCPLVSHSSVAHASSCAHPVCVVARKFPWRLTGAEGSRAASPVMGQNRVPGTPHAPPSPHTPGPEDGGAGEME